ncbi:ricin-type beta-trefoil lectin domain protein [Streptomyces sp. RerS4]|uniref:ricin-type beta-trefoil lectin domain protein n=1 Tax=Streptomyces sp. RerS4 TaxID=2942449 RepID=UPI00201C0545|nr:ricin-type beta-trefoil lectin domain protein [Streptomyces sp. RerS4]UQX03669.1 ricin-type beta-trefoil lectin domain protein [Streptomyces sp. RerS4]
MSPFSAHHFRLPGNRRSRAKRARLAGRTGITVSVALITTLLPIQAWAAPPGSRDGVQLPGLQQDMKAKLDQVEAAKLEGWAGAPVQSPPEYEPTMVAPPAGGSASVALSGDQLVQAGTLPVSIGKASPTEANPAPPAPSGTWSVAVETRTATEAANVDGALIKVTPPVDAATPVDVQLDYKKFKDLYGTEWATRLELKQLPECFLTTPDLPECSVSKDVPSTNDPATGTVRATVDPATSPGQGLRTMAVGGGGPMVLAASDGASGAGGTYKATSLSSSGQWTAGTSGGGFAWSYPLTVPAPPAGPSPKIAFSYSSQAVDGKTSVANGQASWIGDGWDYTPGFVERRYRPCDDDLKGNPSKPNNDNTTDKKKSDLCWAGDSVFMSLGGASTELVRDSASGQWIAAVDDGSKVERKTDSAVANGAKDGEYWVVTTRDGTRYFFGRHDLDGSGARGVTNSVFTAPVFGNHPGEPCYQASFADSSCVQGWRWNLDYVEDVHGNAMIIDWATETNHYAKNEKFKEKVPYIRGGYPTQITYGLRAGALGGAPTGKVEFTVSERCIKEGTTQCSDAEFDANNYGDRQPWWDTPSTLYCKPSAKDCYTASPTFWTRKRLTSVITKAQRTEGATELSLVDRWDLAQSFPRQRTDTHPPLWLESITRTGYGVPKDSKQESTSLPAVSFLPNVRDMPNRVAKSATDATPDFDRLRVETVRTETGGEISVSYSSPCPVGAAHPKPEENTTRCYPVHWSPDRALETPPLEWFNKYVVDKVTEKDRVARQPDVTTTYTYEGDTAWAKDTDEFTKPELRTYSQWRGYASVLTKQGVTANAGKPNSTEESQKRVRYFRGMSGDAGRAKITLKDSTGTEDLGEDLPQFQGMTAESITYTKAGGSITSRALTWPWSQKTAARPRDGTTPLEAHRQGASRTDEIQIVSGGKSRLIRTLHTREPGYGLITATQVDVLEHNGSSWSTSEQTCTTTSYVHNADKYLIGLPQRARITAGDCANSPTATVLNDTRTSYDALNAFGAAPVKGLVHQADTLDSAGTGWVTSARIEYDALGRSVKVYDTAGNPTSSSFSPSTGTPYSVTVTNALGHTATSKTDPGRGSTLEATDTNGRKVTTAYDNLGRSTAVWTPSQDPSRDKAAYTFSYQITEHEAPAVTSSTLQDDGTYTQSVAIYDGLLRPRQNQREALGGGRLITDTLYSANGTVSRTNNGYHAEGAPTKKIFVPESVFAVPNSTETAYDGLGRPVRSTTLHADVPQYSSTKQYGGDFTLTRSAMSVDGTTPLKGSSASKTWTDPLGRTSAVEHATSTDLTTWNRTSYSYDVRRKLSKVTDAAGNSWTYGYDARGRKTSSEDPDTGRSEFGFNNLDQQVWTKDSSGRTQYTTYDALGRTTEVRDNAADGPLVASFTFDTLTGAKGKPVSSTRYEGATAYKSEVTGYDAEYRPTGSKITIPDVPATKGLAGTYVYSTTYTPTGKVQSTTLPATPGGLAAEKLVTRYDSDGMPQSMSGLAWYTADVKYSPYGEILRTASGNAPNRVWTTVRYNPNTGQVTNQISDRETAPNRISDVSYTYDPAGTIASITDDQPGGRTDRQCFAYNPMGQLTKAWTGKTAACTGPSLADVTPGPDGDGFWQEYQFDNIGNRTKLINRDLTNSALDDETTYTYGVTLAANGAQPPLRTQPHALAKVEKTTRKPGSTVNSLSTYEYDAAGNTKSRRIDGDTQTLNWDRRGKLTSATSPGIGAVSLIGASGKCVDVENAGTADGTPVQIYPCNETRAQQWRLTGDTVRALDKCLTTSGTKLVLATCDGSDKQKFVYRAGDKSLNNPATNQCVDVPNNAADGSDLQLWSCNATGPQQFAFDNTTTYLYDTGGNRLIEETGSSRTLYLGDTEITVNKAGQALDAVRYYSGAGATTVRRTSGKTDKHELSVQLADHHGTATTTIDQNNGQTVSRRKSDPYGNPRGTQPGNWPGNHTFLGNGVDDTNTGLTHIGAREYDSTIGRFISVDPIIDITQPFQMNGYTYASGNPINKSDPTGLIESDCYAGHCGGHYNPRDDVLPVNHPSRPTPIWGDYNSPKVRPKPKPWTPAPSEPLMHAPPGKTVVLPKQNAKEFFEIYRADYRKQADSWGGELTPEQDWRLKTSALLSACEQMKKKGCNPEDYLGDHLENVAGEVGLYEGGGMPPGGSLLSGVGGKSGKTAKGSGCNSFIAGTEVLLADGTSKPIEEVVAGDEITATDPETGETSTKTVTATIFTEDDKRYVDVSIQTNDGIRTITTTDHHPFWSESDQAWKDAGQLTPGVTLRTDEGVPVAVVRTHSYQASTDTFNLTVADFHTYYVLAGETPVLVHNSNCDVPSGSLQGEKLAQKLRLESANSPFTGSGQLTPDAISGSRLAMPGTKMGNKELQARFAERGGASQWGKYSTETHQSPYGDYQVHYYMNRVSGEVMYDYDYKVVMNRRGSAP